MKQKKIFLASDNWAPAHPQILKAIMDANEGYAPSYGTDLWTEEAQKLIQEVFKKQCKIFMVPSGTGSNVLALKIACKRYESILC
ncbi:MAG: beta-eliminating lyase-related protein, partial [Parachlamydiaceae bacterium]|nr:beta-eliminating lyase-related protein [Parachlamydiaceae bacterium]